MSVPISRLSGVYAGTQLHECAQSDHARQVTLSYDERERSELRYTPHKSWHADQSRPQGGKQRRLAAEVR